MVGLQEVRTRSERAGWVIGVTLGVSALAAEPARAAPEDRAESAPAKVAEQGVVAYEDGDYQRAADLLASAYRELQAPTVGLYLARSLVKVGRWVDAAVVYGEVHALSPDMGKKAVQQKAQADAAAEKQMLMPRIPKVVLELAGAAAQQVQIAIDGRSLSPEELANPRPVDPGRHVIVASVGSRSSTQTVELTEAETRSVRFDFGPSGLTSQTQPVPSASPVRAGPDAPHEAERTGFGWSHPLTLAALGVGATGLVVGSITGALALSKQKELDESGCVNQHCSTALAGDVQNLNSLRTASTVGFVVGGLGLAGAVTLVLIRPARPNQASVSAWVAPAMVGAKGVF